MYDPHLKDQDDILAARYALGVAAKHEIDLAERRLEHDERFGERVAMYDALFSKFDQDLETIDPTPSVWNRIDSAVEDIENSPFTETVRAAERNWEPVAPGILRKLLYVDKVAGAQILMYKVSPGTQFAGHGHLIAEECLVLDGEIAVDGVTVRTGDLHIAYARSRHGILTSPTGALLYVRADIEMQS